MHPLALVLLPFVPVGRGEFGGEAWTLALSPARCSRLRGSGAGLGQLEGAALPGSDRHNRILFLKGDHGGVLASLETLLHRLWDMASCFLSPGLAGVSALRTCLRAWMPCVPRGALTLNKAAAPALSFHVVKSVNSGYRNTALNFR